MNFSDIEAVVGECRYKDLDFNLMFSSTLGAVLEIGANVVDNETEREVYMTGRKWVITPDMPKSDIVRTVFLAVMTWEEHEIRENFRYKGRDIFSPHFEVE